MATELKSQVGMGTRLGNCLDSPKTTQKQPKNSPKTAQKQIGCGDREASFLLLYISPNLISPVALC